MNKTTLKDCLRVTTIAKRLKTLREICHQEGTRKELVAWIGAGMSIGYGYPSWQKFLEICSSEFPLKNREMVQGLLEDKLFDLCAEYCFRVNKSDTEKKLTETFSSPETNLSLYPLVPLDVQKVITTNYDRVIETSIPWLVPSNPHRIINARNALKGQQSWFLKLHGTVEDQETWTFTTSHYVRNYAKTEFFDVLKQIIAENSIVIFGSSLVDDYFLEIFEEAKKEKLGGVGHYAILAVGSDEEGKARGEYLKYRYDIEVIPYIPGSGHQFVGEAINYLAPTASSLVGRASIHPARLRALAKYHINKDSSCKNDTVGTIRLLKEYFEIGVSDHEDKEGLLRKAIMLKVRYGELDWIRNYDEAGWISEEIDQKISEAVSHITLKEAPILDSSGKPEKDWYSAYCQANSEAMLRYEKAIVGRAMHGVESLKLVRLKRFWMTGECSDIRQWLKGEFEPIIEGGSEMGLRKDIAKRLHEFGQGLLELREKNSEEAFECFRKASLLWRSGHDPSAQKNIDDNGRRKKGHAFIYWYQGVALLQNAKYSEAKKYFAYAIDSYVDIIKGKPVLRRWSKKYFKSNATELAYEVRRYGSKELLWVLETSRCLTETVVDGRQNQSRVIELLETARGSLWRESDLLVQGLFLLLQFQSAEYGVPLVAGSEVSQRTIMEFNSSLPDGLKSLLLCFLSVAERPRVD